MNSRGAFLLALATTLLTTFASAAANRLNAFAAQTPHCKAAAYNPMNEAETKGNFAAWALHAFSIPQNHNHPLPTRLYLDVNNNQRYVFGQAVALGLIKPSSKRLLGTKAELTKAIAADGLIHLLHIDTGRLSPYQYALSKGWFVGTSPGTTLKRRDMAKLYDNVKAYLTVSAANQATTRTGTIGGYSVAESGSHGAASTGTTLTTTATPFQIPAIPASGELNLGSVPFTAQVAANPTLDTTAALPAAPGQTTPVQLDSVIYNPDSPNIVVTGHEQTGGRRFYPEVWLQVNELGTGVSHEVNQWQYPVDVNSDGSFAYAIHVPFPADTYEIQVAPPLTTSQTTLTYSFDTNQQSVSNPFNLNNAGADSNIELGMLTSVWANYTDPAIQALAKRITQGLSSPLAMAQAVYDWEGQHIGYNGKLLANNGYGWSTTEETLSSKVGICVDYANVADALLRALGIPTQMIVGYANDSSVQEVDNGNNGHAWNRSWIGNSWIFFDPTWSRLYFLGSANALPGPHDLWVFQPQWFNPPTKTFTQTHRPIGIEYQ